MKFSRNLVLFGALLVFFGPLLATLLGVRPNSLENREPVAAPEVTPSALAYTSTYEEMGDFLVDRFALREFAVQTRARINDRAWKVGSDQVLRGEEGWLYYRDSFRNLCSGDPGRSAQSLSRHFEELHESGVVVRSVVVPSRPSVYPEFVPQSYAESAQCRSEGEQDLRISLEHSGPSTYLSIYEDIDAAKQTADRPIYYARDTHWNELGGLVMIEAVIDELAPGAFSTGDVVVETDREFETDLTRILGLPRSELVPDISIERPGVTMTMIDPTHYRSASVAGELLVEGRTLVLHDSFVEVVQPEFAIYFADVTFVQMNDLLDAPDAFDAVETIIYVGAERNIDWHARVLDELR